MLRKNVKLGDYGCLQAKVWASEVEIKKDIFERRGTLMPMRLFYLDIPYIYDFNELGISFMTALHKCNDTKIFSLKSVQILIETHRRKMNKWNNMLIGFPVICQLALFWIWSNIFLMNEHEN